jgi:hypothetical protein
LPAPAGLAPLIATWLISQTGDSLSPSYYLMFCGLLSLSALMAIQARARRAGAVGATALPASSG